MAAVDFGTFRVCSPEETPEEPFVRLAPALAYGYFQSDTLDAGRWIVEHVKPGDKFADVGTGTGILSVLAAKCGAQVTAFESDPEVSEIASQHFDMNGVTVELRRSFPEEAVGRWDLGAANIGAKEAGRLATELQERIGQVWVTNDVEAS